MEVWIEVEGCRDGGRWGESKGVLEVGQMGDAVRWQGVSLARYDLPSTDAVPRQIHGTWQGRGTKHAHGVRPGRMWMRSAAMCMHGTL